MPIRSSSVPALQPRRAVGRFVRLALVLAGALVPACAPVDEPVDPTLEPDEATFSEAGLVTDVYRPLDLTRAAVRQYGAGTTVFLTSQHVFGWRARLASGEERGLDVAAAARAQYGARFTAVMRGIGPNDWAAVNLGAAQPAVLPVLLLASDQAFVPAATVARARNRLANAARFTAGFYADRVGATFPVLAPIVLISQRGAASWDRLSAASAVDANRYDLLDAAERVYHDALGEPGPNLRALLVPYTGEGARQFLGAASRGRYAMVPQVASRVACVGTFSSGARLGTLCGDLLYATTHELGHTFDLPHTCEVEPAPACDDSVMQAARMPQATLSSREVGLLRSHPMFTLTR